MAVKRSTIAWAVLFGLLALLTAAWIDGGEEPVRAIVQPVEVPETAL